MHACRLNAFAEDIHDIIAECSDFDEPEWDGPGDDEDEDGEGD